MKTTEAKKAKKAKQSPAKMARKMQGDMREQTMDRNSVFTTAKNVSPLFMDHAVNMQTGEHGIAFLIAEILREREAVFPANIGETGMRNVALSAAMLTDEIEEKVEEVFRAGSIRYPKQTVKTYLSAFMNPESEHFVEQTASGLEMPRIGRIAMTTEEDKPRTSFQPRKRWFIIAD